MLDKSTLIKSYKDAQLKLSMLAILCFLIYYFIVSGNFSFHNLFKSVQFYICVLAVGGYFALVEEIINPLKKDVKSIIETLKTKMIVKICKCNFYCECKEELNDYMKEERGIKII